MLSRLVVTLSAVAASALGASPVVAVPASPAVAVAASPAVAVPASPAVAVAVVRTGGIQGSMSLFAVAGPITPQARHILRLASSPQFRSLRPRYLPANPCCDRYRYEVKVGYRNGVEKKVVTVEGAPGTPAVLLEVIRRVTTMPRPTAALTLPGFPLQPSRMTAA